MATLLIILATIVILTEVIIFVAKGLGFIICDVIIAAFTIWLLIKIYKKLKK